jgi:hypothetical protein
VSRSRHRRRSRGRWLVAVAAALAVLVLVVTMAWADRNPDEGGGGASADASDGLGTALTSSEDTLTVDPTGSPAAGSDASSGSGTGSKDQERTELVLQPGATEARRLDAVPLSGSYRPGATLRVQLEEDGTWSSFPLRIVVGEDGHFATYVELGGTGPNRLRMLEPATGATSDVVVVTVR